MQSVDYKKDCFMGLTLRWENDRWVIDRITNTEYSGKQPAHPLYKKGDSVYFRNEIMLVEWACLTLVEEVEVRWYDVKKGNNHSRICEEFELSPVVE